MGFKAFVIAVMLAAGALGGVWAHFSASGEVVTAEFVYASARGTIRKTMRRFDRRYYERGETYHACIAGYGQQAYGKTNAELVWSCECADKSIGSLGRDHRKIAMSVLRDEEGARDRLTVTTSRFLEHCRIAPTKRPEFNMSIRGAQ